jgi:hypothetical protein
MKRNLDYSKIKQLGAILILIGLLLPVFLGMMALAIDVGYMLVIKNKMQVAADSAALIAADSIQHGEGIDAAYAWALTATDANGYTDGLDSTIVTITIPPGGSDSYSENSNFVKVTVQHTTATFLAGFLGFASTLTSASAISGPAGLGNPCVLSLDTSSKGTIKVQGSSTVIATNCGIFANSNNANAIDCTGKSNHLNTTLLSVVGGIDTSNCDTSLSNSVNVNTPITIDPFIGFPVPSPSLPCTAINTSPKIINLTPGTYCGTSMNSKTVNMAAGTYVIYGGGFSIGGDSSISGTGVTIYNSGAGTTGDHAYGSINLGGTGGVNLSAPLTGDYAGMLIYQNPLNSLPAIIGQGGSLVFLSGNSYFPSSKLTLSGGNTATYPIGSVVAKTVDFNTTYFYIKNTFGAAGTTAIRSALYK